MNKNATSLDRSILEHLDGTTLFYPCSGDDLLLPIATFSPFVSDFWFVDIAYFRRCPPEKQPPLLSEKDGYTLLDKQIRLPNIPEEDWQEDDKYRGNPPSILVENYRHLESEPVIRVHRHRRRGPSALRTEIYRLGVFFYRGDSEEGGSRTLWLTVHPRQRRQWLLHEVLGKLIDGGLIVTDGAMCKGEDNPYRAFRRLHCNRDVSDAEAVALVQPFEDEKGRLFAYIGCLGQHHHYGPAMVWKMTQRPL